MQLAAQLRQRLPLFAEPPEVADFIIGQMADRQTCIQRGAFEMNELRLPVTSFDSGLIGEADWATIILTCNADGFARLSGKTDSRSSLELVGRLRDYLASPERTGMVQPQATLAREGQSPKLAVGTLTHDLDVSDCSYALRIALPVRSNVPYREFDADYSAIEDPFFELRRKEYPGRAVIQCHEGWTSIAVGVDGAGGVNAQSDLAALIGAIRPQLAKLQWRIDLRLGVSVSFPRTARASAETTAQGGPRSLVSHDAGVRYLARWIDDPAPGASDPESRFTNLRTQLEGEGFLIRDTRAGFYGNRPSLAVWSQVIDDQGRALRHVAQYVLTSDNRIIALEVAYRVGANVNENLGRFSASLSL